MKRLRYRVKRFAILAVFAVSAVSAQGIWVNDAGVLREIKEIWVNDAGVLREITEVWVNDGGTLRQVFDVLVVELGLKLHLTFNFGATCRAYVRIHSDGEYYESDKNGNFASPDADKWLESGSSADVWIERTITDGTLDLDEIGNGRVSLATGDRTWGVLATAQNSKSATVTIDFYDAASGGNLLESTSINTLADGSDL